MGVVDRKLELFENIVRLRRIAKQVPDSEDLAAVRAALEEELGPTVSQRLAGRILGVSHVALRRWIESGDLPVVYSTRGRQEVPVSALLRLRDEIEEDQGDTRCRYVIKPTMERHRRAAESLKIPKALLSADGGKARIVTDDPHSRATARSLAYHRALARRLRKPMVEEARHVLYRWRRSGQIDDRYGDRWEEILDRPIAEIRKTIVEETPAADDLRQNSPLAGQLSEAERRRIVEEVV